MKKTVLLISLLALSFMLISCATKKHCDAYGNKSGSVETALKIA